MNATVVFLGPTLPPGEARRLLDITYLPPVSQGDVLRAVRRGARVIGIVDGYFETIPAVLHKEILWALNDGIRVLGAASIGALRAAELWPFGMIGVGKVFEAYRSGALEDDDEVAIWHGPSEAGYRPLSEALVNMRATYERTHRDGVISVRTRARLEAIAKELFYPDRSYEAVLKLARQELLPRTELDALAAWARTGAIDIKRLDALELLREVERAAAGGDERPAPSFDFGWTHAFQHVYDTVAAERGQEA